MEYVSEFRQAVFNCIKHIPAGQVASYSQVAKAINKPRAARAVGNALNKNPDAPVVPCHRVVESDGSLGGYAEGRARKIALLQKEGVCVRNNKLVDFQKITAKLS